MAPGPLRRLLAAPAHFDRIETAVDGCRVLSRRSRAQARRDAPSVVLVAGLGLSGRYLLPAGVELAHRLPVWIPDPPGYGGSEAPAGKVFDIAGRADHLVAWMDTVGLRRAALVGNSVGCQIAAEAAGRHPGRVSHLVLQGPTMDACARTAPRQAARLLLNAALEPSSVGPIQALDWLRTGVPRALRSYRLALEHAIEERLPAIGCPALVVRGAKDLIAPQRWAEELVDRLPDGALRVIPGATHTIPYAAPLELARITEAFLTRA